MTGDHGYAIALLEELLANLKAERFLVTQVSLETPCEVTKTKAHAAVSNRTSPVEWVSVERTGQRTLTISGYETDSE